MRFILLLLTAALAAWLVLNRLQAPANGPAAIPNDPSLPPLQSTTAPGRAMERTKQVLELNDRRQSEIMNKLKEMP